MNKAGRHRQSQLQVKRRRTIKKAQGQCTKRLLQQTASKLKIKTFIVKRNILFYGTPFGQTKCGRQQGANTWQPQAGGIARGDALAVIGDTP
ncbi:hypothetical protein [Desulfovibrio sp. MES5]|uniref:hypothetical protein n=1 Tax=Desulfovibrio sp. MES5 TaxID=1899016 RepID=UPI0025BD63F0|nr:hypothetical protein [Desulfovibrio sp. MES5]